MAAVPRLPPVRLLLSGGAPITRKGHVPMAAPVLFPEQFEKLMESCALIAARRSSRIAADENGWKPASICAHTILGTGPHRSLGRAGSLRAHGFS